MASTIPLHTVHPNLVVPLEVALNGNEAARTLFDQGDEMGALALLHKQQTDLTNRANDVAAQIVLLTEQHNSLKADAAVVAKGTTILNVLLPDRVLRSFTTTD